MTTQAIETINGIVGLGDVLQALQQEHNSVASDAAVNVTKLINVLASEAITEIYPAAATPRQFRSASDASEEHDTRIRPVDRPCDCQCRPCRHNP